MQYRKKKYNKENSQEKNKQLILQELQIRYNAIKELLFVYFEEEMKLCAINVIGNIVIKRIMSTFVRSCVDKNKFYMGLKSYIENYCTFLIHKKLLKKDYIDINQKETQYFIKCVCNPANKNYEHIIRKLNEYRTIFPKISNFNVPDIRSICEIKDHLTNKYQFLTNKICEDLKPYNQDIIKHILMNTGSETSNLLKDDLNKERENNNLEKAITSQKDCMAKINSILEELTEQHQPSPNSKIEEASAEQRTGILKK